MPPRQTPRLAYGEYVQPEPTASVATWQARLLLIDAVRRVYPTMLQQLSTDVFPAYKALAETGFDLDAIVCTIHSPFTRLCAVDLRFIELRFRTKVAEPAGARSKSIPSDAQIAQAVKAGDFATFERLTNKKEIAAYRRRQRLTPRIKPQTVLRKCASLSLALRNWASTFNADVLWFLDETLRTLRGWYVVPDWRDAHKWNPMSGVSSRLAIGKQFRFDCAGWEMQTLTWATYSESVRQKLEQKLAKYEMASRKLAESKGLVRVQQKYSLENFNYFVLYQFAGRKCGAIANEVSARTPEGLDESTVTKGVRAAAKLVGWDHLRPASRQSNRKIR